MKRPSLRAVLVCLGILCVAWIDYDDQVVRKEPVFGKEFQGFALLLSTEKADFEQDSGERIHVVLRNTTDAVSVLPETAGKRDCGLLIILADKGGGTSLVSQNLLTEAHPTLSGQVTAKATVELANAAFDDLALAPFSEYENGMPSVKPGAPRTPGAGLVPQLYVVRAILYGALPGKRPDFAVASDTWPVLLRPKDGKRMTEEERRAKMEQWLAKMSEGAYGGIGVSSQLAALGESAVEPLLAMAEKQDATKEAVRESRIWAIVTLCNTGSPRAEEYILGKLRDPLDFGDLAFLAWHSQAFRSRRVTETLRQLAEDAACDRPMPWEAKHGPESRIHGRDMLEYVFKHFAGLHESITDATAAGLVRLGDEKLLAFGISTWKPSSGQTAIDTLAPLCGKGPVHSNVKKAILACLAQAAVAEGVPAYDREADSSRQWLAGCTWLHARQSLDSAALTVALRWLALEVPRDQEALQAEVIAALSGVAGPGFPVAGTQPRLPDDWVATWRWALQTSGLPAPAAIGICTRMMRTRDELPDAVRLGLLQELKRLIGAEFPLPEGKVDLEQAWPECGNWLIQKGYFKKKGE
jgi:hypothetical protein